MNRNRNKQERGAVLIVALIMLAMVTFLVVAFVGFSRFERAAVEASLVRAEAGHAKEIGLVEAQEQVMDLMRRDINHGMMVSQNTDGSVVLAIPTNRQLAELFANGLTNWPRVPVFIDRDGDGRQEYFPFYLDLNSATNRNLADRDKRYQVTLSDATGRQIKSGDPHWIGLLEKPGLPHGKDNKFVARYAHLTVPLHKALNARYNHNDLKRATTANPDAYSRQDGGHPRELNLAAPLGQIDPINFPYTAFSAFMNASSQPDASEQNSAFGVAASLHRVGDQVEDAMHLARPSKGYQHLLNRTGGYTAGQMRNLTFWLNSKNPALSGRPLATEPYSYYQFLSHFSTTPLPEETEKFDVNSIRDEVLGGDTVVNRMSGTIHFISPHGLKNGDKVEPVGVAPGIDDPISFVLNLRQGGGPGLSAPALQALVEGQRVETTVPHRLAPGESGELMALGASPIRPLYRAGQDGNGAAVYLPVKTMAVLDGGEYGLRLQSTAQGRPVTVVGWGVLNKDTKRWFLSIPKTNPADANGDLPTIFDEANFGLRYRYNRVPLDALPYFVKVESPNDVVLHRSAALDEASRVKLDPVANGRYTYQPGSSSWKPAGGFVFGEGSRVRFVPNPAANLPQNGGAALSGNEVFTVVLNGTTGEMFLNDAGGTRFKPTGAGTHVLELVYRFKQDLLAATLDRMVNLMLNESLDVSGGARVGRDGNELGGGPVQFALGGQTLPLQDQNNPAYISFGVGGQPEARGLWHHPKRGLAWNRGSQSAFAGHYSREVERTVQVAANIVDLVSGYTGNNLPLISRDRVLYSKGGTSTGLLPFGAFSRDAMVATRVEMRGAAAGILLCLRLDGQSGAPANAYEIRYVKGGGKARVELFVWKDGNRKGVAASKSLPVAGPGDVFELKAEVMGGREVSVWFNGHSVLQFENQDVLNGGSGLLAQGAAIFTDLRPGIFPAALSNAPDGWSFQSDRQSDPLPNAWRGVFRRGMNNELYLTGFQRMLTSGVLEGGNVSWYQRQAPVVIGIKDRHAMPGRGLTPAITEYSLRLLYNRKDKALYARLATELNAPGRMSRAYQARVLGQITGVTYSLGYTGANNITTYSATPVTGLTGAFDAGQVVNFNDGDWRSYVVGPTGGGVAGGFIKIAENIPLSDGQDNTLTDIRIDSIDLRINALIGSSGRVVDFLDDTLTAGNIHFANIEPHVVSRLHVRDQGLNEWGHIPDWKADRNFGDVGNQQHSRRAIYNDAVYQLRAPGIPADRRNRPPAGNPQWIPVVDMDVRMVDLSWQVNDPLVNSHGTDYSPHVYAPGGFPRRMVTRNNKTVWEQVPVPTDDSNYWVRRQWMPVGAVTDVAGYGIGVNLGKPNHADRSWRLGNNQGANDTSIKDASVSGAADWRFPDIARGRIPNIGWLGQVHRGTPWQTLYLKSKIPGRVVITEIDDTTGEATTLAPHMFQDGEKVTLSGQKPTGWVNVAATGDVGGSVLVRGPNTFVLQGAAGNELEGLDGLTPRYQTPGLFAISSKWENWAGSRDTMPANDRRLIEPFAVGTDAPVRGRFSVNNFTPASWSAVFSGMSVPVAASSGGGGMKWHNRILGANNPNTSQYPYLNRFGQQDTEDPRSRDGRIQMRSQGWLQMVGGINTVRGTNTFTRVTDVLAVPELSDQSPYLGSLVWRAAHTVAPTFADELDEERVPMQLLSLLKVDDQPVFETYIFAERLRPALRLNLDGQSGPAVDAKGTVLNYEVAGQTMRRVVYEMKGAKAWHQSIKNGHPGFWRDREGKLRSLPALKPIIRHSSTLQMN